MNTQQAMMLLLITAGAFLMPLVSERIGWFTAPCEMVYGAVVATLIPGAGNPGSFITTLAQFGFLLLLFLAGLEIDFSLLHRRGMRSLLSAGLVAVALQALALGLVALLRQPPIDGLLVGALSVSLLLVVLHEGGQAQSEFGQTLLVVGAIGEFCSILSVTAYDLIGRYGLNWMLGLAALKLAALLIAGYLALRGLSLAAVRQPTRFRRLFIRRDPSELGVRAALAFMLCFAAIAVWLRVEQILATFIAGLVCSYAFRGQHVVTKKLTTIGQGFFVPMFFISVGLQVNASSLLNGPVLAAVAAMLAALVLTRLAVAPLLVLAGLRWREALPGALLLSAPLTLLVAIAQVGIDLGQLDATAYSSLLGAAIASAVIFPGLARALMRRLPRADDVPHVVEAAQLHVYSAPLPQPLASVLPELELLVEREM